MALTDRSKPMVHDLLVLNACDGYVPRRQRAVGARGIRYEAGRDSVFALTDHVARSLHAPSFLPCTFQLQFLIVGSMGVAVQVSSYTFFASGFSGIRRLSYTGIGWTQTRTRIRAPNRSIDSLLITSYALLASILYLLL